MQPIAGTAMGAQVAADEPLPRNCERSEWRSLARPLGVLLAAFGAGWAYTTQVHGTPLGWPVALAYAVGLTWLARALVGSIRGRMERMAAADLDAFRDRCFWSMPARCSYAAILVCDGLFLLDVRPDQPGLFFALSALAAVFSPRIAVLSIALGACFLL